MNLAKNLETSAFYFPERPAILSGGCLELMPGFDLDRVLALMKAGRITKFFSVPTIYVRLLTLDRLKEIMGDVRYCFSAAASMAAETVHHRYAGHGVGRKRHRLHPLKTRPDHRPISSNLPTNSRNIH